MNTKSVRFRLTIWYTLSFFIAAIVIFASFYLVTKQALFNQVDATLTSHSNKVKEVISRNGQNMHENMMKQAFLTEFSEIPGMLLVVVDDAGKIITNTTVSEVSNQLFNQLYEEARRKDRLFFINRKIDEISVRLYINPIVQNNKLVAMVIIGHPIDVIEKSLTNLLIMLGVVFVIFIIPTIIGGSLLAKGATASIVQISEKVRKISSENLDERVESPNTGDELEELATVFNDLLERLGQSFKRERQFIGDVAHELKTPLATQRSNIEVILSKVRPNNEYRKSLSETLIDNNKIATTLKNILDLAWSETENEKTRLELVDLSELIEELKDLASKMSLQKNITIIGSVTPNINISGRKDKLFRAILNIVDNAIKYTQNKGKISITLNKTSDKARLEIKDTGIGITKGDLPHIFERFYRGSKTDRTFGSGLGLSITQAVIHAHHGKIEVESKVGQGTIVAILLPLVN